MSFRLRDITGERKFADHLRMEVVEQVVPTATIEAVLDETHSREQRHRKLSMRLIVWLVIGLSLYADAAIGVVLEKITAGLRLLWLAWDEALPRDSALTYRRYQLGVRPMVALFRRVCQPLATPDTPGAFLFGLRLVALDGHRQDVPDTPENAAYFGRPRTDRGVGGFPQALLMAVCEVGTHALFDAGIWPCHTSEHKAALRLARALGPGMLAMWDRGLHDFALIEKAFHQGAQVLARLPANVKPIFEGALPDGSYLGWIGPSGHHPRKRGEGMLVRVICYTIEGAAAEGKRETYRLMTSLRDWRRYPAFTLAQAYHERWDEEVTFDEIETHQLAHQPLRSRKPVGVLQELYGALIAHYVVRSVMHEAAQQAGVDPDRLSFTHTVHLMQETLWQMQIADRALLRRLLDRLLDAVARTLLPVRRPRSNPRVVKRKMSNFPLKRRRTQTKQPNVPIHEAIRLI